MTITATRLGRSPLTFDWSNLSRIKPGLSHNVGSLTATDEPSLDHDSLANTWNKLKDQFQRRDQVAFFDAPTDDTLSQANETKKLAEQLRQRNFSDCLFLGIGGSALGPISLLAALNDLKTTDLRFHFMENPDPTEWKNTIDKLNPDKTLVCVVTKSGTTFETVAQFLIALEWLGKARWQTNLVAITDPVKGDLKAFAKQYEIPTLHIAQPMGGRFSVLSPVGLLPLALSGLSIDNFLLGAREIREYLEKTPVEKNPLFTIGQQLIEHFTKRPIHVCMPYSSQLRLISSWFVQLWGESLGKDGKGFTPVAALGATDQHSILQLLRDGPDDKITLFITVDRVKDEVKIPKSPGGLQTHNYSSFALLEGHTLHELLQTEYRATSLVLTKQNRPHLSIRIDQLDERAMGALYFSFGVLTAFTGTLWGINPFDQPGVEEGKIYTRQALREGRLSESDDQPSAAERLRRE